MNLHHLHRVYSFANCVMNGAPFVRHFMSLDPSVTNMRTDGILRLLSGESFRLHEDDKCTLFASIQWKAFVDDNNLTRFADLESCYDFQPITVKRDDVFLWTPFADCLRSCTAARCGDGSPFPLIDRPISDVFPHMPRIPFPVVADSWHRLAQRLSHVDRKAVVLYDPEPLMAEAQSDPALHETIAHIHFYNERASMIFRSYGWTIFPVRPLTDAPLTNWAHYDDVTKRELWGRIATAFSLGDAAVSA